MSHEHVEQLASKYPVAEHPHHSPFKSTTVEVLRDYPQSNVEKKPPCMVWRSDPSMVRGSISRCVTDTSSIHASDETMNMIGDAQKRSVKQLTTHGRLEA